MSSQQLQRSHRQLLAHWDGTEGIHCPVFAGVHNAWQFPGKLNARHSPKTKTANSVIKPIEPQAFTDFAMPMLLDLTSTSATLSRPYE